MRRNKQAQIALFMILGIIFIFIIIVGVYFIGSLKKSAIKRIPEKVQTTNLEGNPIKIFKEECIKKAIIASAYEFFFCVPIFAL